MVDLVAPVDLVVEEAKVALVEQQLVVLVALERS
jgi:hypothetical protein